MTEQWRPIPNYEGFYEVSDCGLVRSIERRAANTKASSRLIKAQIIAPYIRATGYRTVKLAKQRTKVSHYVHRLVALAFHGTPTHGQEVLHADGNKGNNRAANLSWGSRTENMADRTRLAEHATGERHGHAKLTEAQVLAILADNRTQQAVAVEYGVSRRLVGMIRSGKVWKHLHG